MKKSFIHWGFTFLQGCIILLPGIWKFGLPEENLTPFGLVFLLIGLAGLAEWLLNRHFDRHTGDFFWAMATGLCGILLLLRGFKYEEMQELLTALWMVITGLWLFARGQSLHWISLFGWAITITGIIMVIMGLMVGFGHGTVPDGITGILPYLLSGVAILGIALLKRKSSENYNNSIILVPKRLFDN